VRLSALGTVLTLGVTALLWWVWGSKAILPGVVFGGLATGIQLAAVAVVTPMVDGPYAKFMSRWAVGMGLRLAGIGVFVACAVVLRDLFPPLPTAFAYLGVLIPLLFSETRFLDRTRNA
jgi:hypothetical protein